MATVTAERVEAEIAKALESFGADPAQINRDAAFEALDVDSLDLVELAQIVEEEFGVRLEGDDVAKLKTVGDAIDTVVARAA